MQQPARRGQPRPALLDEAEKGAERQPLLQVQQNVIHCKSPLISLHPPETTARLTEVGIPALNGLRQREPVFLHAQQQRHLVRRARLVVEQARRERRAPDLPRALRDVRVRHARAAERLELVHDRPAERVVAVELRVAPARGRRPRARDLRARPVLEDRVGREGEVGRDAEGEEVQVAREEAGDEVGGRELRVLRVGEGDADLVETDSVEHFEGLADIDEVGRVVEVEERSPKLRRL